MEVTQVVAAEVVLEVQVAVGHIVVQEEVPTEAVVEVTAQVIITIIIMAVAIIMVEEIPLAQW